MTQKNLTQRLNIIGQIQDLTPNSTRFSDPFLYYLPQLLNSKQFQNLDAEKALIFARHALSYKTSNYVKDALKILNQIVNREDGSLNSPAANIFYDNHNFHWSELGNNTSAEDVIRHIFNKTLFILSVGKK